MNEKIEAAKKAYQEAAENLIEVVREVYPVGTKLNVQIGTPIITIEVTGHNGSWWYEPGQIYGFNVITGKKRSFSPSQVMEVAP
ncbi:hypothetical protein [Pseudomonas koreensis]|uniref:Uncharacterized protein n=1 Tax=Pseudomonas koreensis TaxID=198620 RepID=A0AA94EMS4_9PSED|nr:hypothetical protein [Pseudomonas koreensis]RVD77065.1 hypothetical protein A9HBioS_3088 [Pseudomonas koreensis]